MTIVPAANRNFLETVIVLLSEKMILIPLLKFICTVITVVESGTRKKRRDQKNRSNTTTANSSGRITKCKGRTWIWELTIQDCSARSCSKNGFLE